MTVLLLVKGLLLMAKVTHCTGQACPPGNVSHPDAVLGTSKRVMLQFLVSCSAITGDRNRRHRGLLLRPANALLRVEPKVRLIHYLKSETDTCTLYVFAGSS